MAYEMKREDALRFVDSKGFEVREDGDELVFRYCPYCGGGNGNKKDEHTFSLNLSSGAFNCFRSSCGMHGHFVELCRDFGFDLDYEIPRVYKRLKQPTDVIKPTNEAVTYLGSRGISEAIVERYEVTSRNDNPGTLVFPFFNERGQLVFVKYRNTHATKGSPKEFSEADTMPILFGMKQAVDFDQPLVVTEGQIDSLSLAEAGIKNPVSVPTGAKGFTWLPYCKEWMRKFPEIIVFGDFENGKVTLYETLKARLPDRVVKVVRGVDYLGEKDANDILRAYGTDALRKAVENACTPLVNWVKDLATIGSLDVTRLDRINTGIPDIDFTLRGLIVGQVVLLTGKRGEGKSTFMSQIVANALDQNESVFVYSGELSNQNFKLWLDYQLAGAKHISSAKTEYGTQYIIDAEAEKKISEWYRGRAYIYDNDYIPDGEEEMKALPDIIEGVIQQYNVRLICVDNLMTAMGTIRNKDDLFTAQGNFVGQLKRIAMKYQVVVILIAHPRKSLGEFSNDDVSGSADITNKVDVVMNYGRADSTAYQGKIEITKNRMFGNLAQGKEGAIPLMYSENTKRIFPPNKADNRVYGWEDVQIEMTEVDEDLPF